jgi:hypothetical protein
LDIHGVVVVVVVPRGIAVNPSGLCCLFFGVKFADRDEPTRTDAKCQAPFFPILAVEVIPSIRAECPALFEVKMMRQFVQENLAEEFKRKQSAFCDMDFFLPRGKATQSSLRVDETNTQVLRPMLFQSHLRVLVCLVNRHAAKVMGNFALSNK